MKKFDVIVIGAGPSGIAAIKSLMKNGVNALLLEKEILPRDKPCGGLISKHLANKMELNLSAEKCNEITGRIYEYCGKSVQKDYESPYFVFDRSVLDYEFLKTVFPFPKIENKIVKNVRLTDHYIIECVDGEEFTSTYVVNAGGPNNLAMKNNFQKTTGTFGRAVDFEIKLDGDIKMSNYIRFDFSYPIDGYNWMFPVVSNRLKTGLYVIDKGHSFARECDKLISKLRSKYSVLSIKEKKHLIPLFSKKTEICSGNMLLVGDAASLVHPVWGEGISWAVKSGELASKSILEHMNGCDEKSLKEIYTKMVDENIRNFLLKEYQITSTIFRKKKELFIRNLGVL